jgi:hypothetical protein
MRDDMTDVEWLRARLARAQQHSEAITDDIHVQDALRLTGTLMRLDRVRESLEEAWTTMQAVYDAVSDRDRMLGADRTVSEPSSGSGGVVADVLRAASAGVRPSGGAVRRRSGRAEDVAV